MNLICSNRKWLFSSASLALLVGQALPTHAQYPVVSISPAQPVSTEPFALTITDSVPEGTPYFIQVIVGISPHGSVTNCNAVQKNGSASCMLGRIAPGFYMTDISGGRNFALPINFNVLPPGDSTVSALQGQYAFLVEDQLSGSSATPAGAAASGSFTADGQGNITAGVMDVNGVGVTFQDLPVTGAYTLNATGQGIVTLKTSQGTASLAIVVPTAQTLGNVTNADLIALPGSLVTGGGILVNQSGLLQSTSPVNPGFASTLNGGYQAILSGEFSPQVLPVGGALQFAFSTTGSVASAGQLTIGGAHSALPGCPVHTRL